MAERIAIDYRQTTVYFETALNAVGATTSMTLRTGLAIPGVNDAWVHKYGVPYPITTVTNGQKMVPRGAPGNVGRYDVYSNVTNQLLGQVTDNGASAFLAGAAIPVAEAIRVELICTAGAYTVTNGDILRLWTNADPASYDWILSGETVTLAAGDMITWYFANGGSTYYDSGYKYGGRRHVPALGNARRHYFDISTAVAATIAGAGTTTEVMDSEVYEVDDAAGFIAINAINFTLQSSLGQTPTIARGIGARTSRINATWEFSNVTARYFNENGNDANDGRWQYPKRTLAAAYAAAGAGLETVYGGDGATPTGGVFQESLNMVNANRQLHADHEYVPRLAGGPLPANYVLQVSSANTVVRGFTIEGGKPFGVLGAPGNNIQLRECTVRQVPVGVYEDTAAVQIATCRFEGCGIAIQTNAGAVAFNLQTCMFTNCVVGWNYISVAAGGILPAVYSCYFVNCSIAGMKIEQVLGAGSIGNCLFWNTQWGIWGTGGAFAHVATVDECIFNANRNPTGGGYGILLAGGATITANRPNAYDNDNDFSVGVAVIAQLVGDPALCDPANGYFGISGISVCVRGDLAGTGDVGPFGTCVYVTANNVEIDGFIFDCQLGCPKAIQNNPAALCIDLEWNWCTFRNTMGIAVDIASTGGATGAIGANNLYEACGDGVFLEDDANTLEESAFVGCRRNAIAIETQNQLLVHISISGSRYGIYAQVTAASVVLRDSIVFGCSSYAIYEAGVSIFPMWCLVDGAVSALVDLSDPTNLAGNPLFIDWESDLHLWTIEGGYAFDSRCKDAASDGYDMGCYLFDRGITDDSWLTGFLDDVSFTVEEAIAGKGISGFENAQGASHLAGKTHRRQLSLRWNTDTAISEDHRYLIEYLSTLIEEDHQGVTPQQTILRVHTKPTSGILVPTSGVVDAAAGTFYVAAANWQRNRFRGWDMFFRWIDRADGTIVPAARTVTCAGAAWIANQWLGYWYPQAVLDDCGETIGYRWFRILANTPNTLTVSDPYGFLRAEVATATVWIVSFHKIASNDWQYIVFEPEGAEYLLDGTRTGQIGPIRCKLAKTGVDVNGQIAWRADYTHDRIPDRLDLEEYGPCV